MAGETKVTRGGQGHQTRGHTGQGHGQGQSRGHGHDGKGRVATKAQQQQRQRQKTTTTTTTTSKKPARKGGESAINNHNNNHNDDSNIASNHNNNANADDDNDDDVTVMENGEERVMMTRHDALLNGHGGGETDLMTSGGGNDDNDDVRDSMTQEEEDDVMNGERMAWGSQDWNDNAGLDREPKRMAKDKYDIRTFNSSLDEFVGIFSNPKYQEMRSDYPVDDLLSVVSMVSATIEDYKEHSQHTQHQLCNLRDKMKTVKENLHLSITRQAFDLAAEEKKTPEEIQLQVKLTQLNAAVAEANSEVAEAKKIATETEQTALQANIAAEQARKEAERIEEEIRLKRELDRKKKEEEEKKRQEEEKRRLEEQKRREEEEKAKEEARKKLEASGADSKEALAEKAKMDSWPAAPYAVPDGTDTGDLQCVVRGNPANFNKREVKVITIEQTNIAVTYGDQEELISKIIELRGEKEAPAEPIYVAIPYVGRLPAAREPVIKIDNEEGQWEDLVTQEVALDGYKEFRFAQAKVPRYGKLLVMSRFKHDYFIVKDPHKVWKFTSTYDQRVTLSLQKNTFVEQETIVMQIQPLDSTAVSDFRSMDNTHKALLTSSPILNLEWNTPNFSKPISVTLPVPPNPAKAKKLAMLKKQKEEKMKAPAKPAVDMDALLGKDKDKDKKKPAPGGKQQKAAATEEAEGRDASQASSQKATKWYMGQYGQNEDDENDKLCMLACTGGRWSSVRSVVVTPVKLDLVTFDLDHGYEKIIVFRTRVDTEDDVLKQLVTGLTQQLSQRFVKILVRQKNDDLYDVCCNVVPSSALERAEKQMKTDGYDAGSGKVQSGLVKEGDILLLSLRGNLRFQDSNEQELRLVFNSNLPTQVTFRVTEIDRYLQRNYDVYRGALRIARRYEIHVNSKKKQKNDEENSNIKTEVVCDEEIEIPKYHVEPDPIPRRVSVVIHDSGPVNKTSLRLLAADIGDEWTRLGDLLGISRVRQQAIVRTVRANEGGEDDIRYEMLMTWFKRCPQASDKMNALANALLAAGRDDLAYQLVSHHGNHGTRMSTFGHRGHKRSSVDGHSRRASKLQP